MRADTVTKMIAALKDQEYLPGQGLGPYSEVYDGHYASILHRFKPIERDNIHLIYEGLKTQNEMIDGWESKFIQDLDVGIMSDPFDTHQKLLQNIHSQLLVYKELIDSFLAKQPTDVIYRKLDQFPTQFTGPAKPTRSGGHNSAAS